MPVDPPLPIAVLISGGGTTLKNLLTQIENGQLSADIRLVISSNPNAGGLAHAKTAGVPTKVIQRAACGSAAAFRDTVFAECRESGVDLVVMGGFLKHLLIPADFAGRVINVHPSLVPQFCGRGFYGNRVHAAVLQAGVSSTGCTVHFVDDQYDHGPIILQREVPVLPGDTTSSLAARVFAEECRALPEAIRLFAGRRLEISGDQVIVMPAAG